MIHDDELLLNIRNVGLLKITRLLLSKLNIMNSIIHWFSICGSLVDLQWVAKNSNYLDVLKILKNQK